MAVRVRVRILEELDIPDETKERIEEGINYLFTVAQWGADSHPSLWTAIAEAKKLLLLVDEDEKD